MVSFSAFTILLVGENRKFVFIPIFIAGDNDWNKAKFLKYTFILLCSLDSFYDSLN